jgi:GLPGLI family protein
MKWTFKKIFFLVFLLFNLAFSTAQIINGKIVFERKTNLYKKYKTEDWVKEYIKPEDRNKSDIFELYFNDTCSVFKPQESDLKDENSWMTNKNSVYQNFNTNKRLCVKNIWGEKMVVEDTLIKRNWKITDNKRTISGYNCRKAIWQANDSTKIYAWYTDAIVSSVGPESFSGLPGAILGVAAEDGSIIYFAKSVEIIKPDVVVANIPQRKKQKIYSNVEFKTKLTKDFGKDKWGKAMLNDVFGIW